MANQDVRKNVLLNLRSVTQSCKGGVPIRRLEKDYKDLVGLPIPYKDLGYNSLEAFIKDIPDVIALKRNSDGQLVAEGVADASTSHIASLVSRQKDNLKKKSLRKLPSRSLSTKSTFHESIHSSDLQHNSLQLQSTVKTQKHKPSKLVHHSNPREPPAHVSSRQREIAPRFLKLKNNSKQLTQTLENEFDISSVNCKSNSSTQVQLSSVLSASNDFASSIQNTSDYFNDFTQPTIPPPKPHTTHSLPNRSLLPLNSHTLESSESAKESISLYSKRNKIVPDYHTVLMDQKTKSKGYVSTLYLGQKRYSLYPEQRETKEQAEEAVARKAMNDIKTSQRNSENYLPGRKVRILKDNNLVIHIKC